MATYPAPEPSYCAGRTLLSKPLTPAQWLTCAKYGWDEPTTTATRLAHEFGSTVLAALIALAFVVVLVIWALIRR